MARYARACQPEPLSRGLRLCLSERNVALVQLGECLSNRLRETTDYPRPAAIGQVLPEIHPWIEVVEDQPGLASQARDRPGDPHPCRRHRLVELCSRFEIGFRRGFLRMQ